MNRFSRGGGGGDSSEVRGVDCQEGIAPGRQQPLTKVMQPEEVQWKGVAPAGSKLKVYELQGGVERTAELWEALLAVSHSQPHPHSLHTRPTRRTPSTCTVAVVCSLLQSGSS